MKNKVNESNIIVSKTDYKSDKGLTQAAKKNKDNIVPVDDDKMAKIEKNAISSSTTDSTNTNVSGSSSTPTVTSTVTETQIDAVIEPQDQETIKYLSNVKDPKTNQISKPFVIGDKNYQMVRGMKPNREIVLGVLCLDDSDEMGNHKIHGVEHFEKNIAIPMRERFRNIKEEPNQDKEKFVDHLNLNDVNGFKHFFVNTNTGDVTAKFKTTEEMLKSGIQLKPDERYLDAKKLKQFRYGHYFKPEMNEAEDGTEGTDMKKLKSDVRTLTTMISDKFARAISKLDKNVEKAEFLKYMAEMIGVPYNKLTQLMSSFKDIASKEKTAEPNQAPVVPAAPAMTEHNVIKKDALLESLGVKQTIIKVNKNKNGK